MNDNQINAFEQTPCEAPKEIYQFNYSKEELDEIRRFQINSIIKKPMIVAVINCFLLIYSLIISSGVAVTSFVSAFFLINIISTARLVNSYNKTWKNSIERISTAIYEYRIFESYINICIYHNGEKTRDSKHYFTDIQQIQNSDKWLFLIIGGQSFILRKSDLNDVSVLNAFMYTHPEKTKEVVTANRWSFISVILFIASLLSIMGALFLTNTLSAKNGLFIENTWVFFTFTPIPISSVVFGFVLKSKGYKYKKNVITGVIMTILLCIYGSFVFIF